ncbi:MULTISPECIES: pyrroloquinoline-quinone synthase PqqC [Mesorhizobium]|uniref:Pyrroloquinoline-quinone synthase n=1 Tax=Mesorhizobium denitrificans TaxID=2294114 RepID=A0A371XEM5_9HYPH|nr:MULTISPECIES: pyrroloquinoline-quinone synthase PqqC [Mesorhizobium]RFC67666.1 pyrroloquinoline quinone biosynthesis protein PqqC [Mesorhizobium denitrificans]
MKRSFEIDRILERRQLEALLRQVGEERYHINHPFHRLMVEGKLSKGQMQAWALNRYCYQAAIPRKDAIILSRLDDPEPRIAWRERIIDHDGDGTKPGGIERWLKLATGLGLNVDMVKAQIYALPATRFAVGAYVTLVEKRSLLEAIASSLTELFSPKVISERVPAILKRYDYITEDTLSYFSPRLHQAPRDAEFALAYVLEHAKTAEEQQAAVDALITKCDILWAMLDALHFAYVEPALCAPGAFVPEDHPR